MKEYKLEKCVEYAIADFWTRYEMYKGHSQEIIQALAKETADSHVPIHTDTLLNSLFAWYKGKANYLVNYGIESDLFAGKRYVSFVDFISLVFYDFLLEEILESVKGKMESDSEKEDDEE